MVNIIQKEDLSSDFTNDDSLASGGISVNKAELVSADADNQVVVGADGKLFVPEPAATAVPDASASVTGVVNNTSLQELGGADKLINGVRVGRGEGTTANVEFNTAVGNNALSNNTTGPGNTAVGRDALASNTSGQTNTAVGFKASEANTTGSRNTAVGFNALSNATGSDNTALGYQALLGAVVGQNNTAFGSSTGSGVTTGENNLMLGQGAGGPVSPSGSITTQSNRIVLGNNSITDAYIMVPWTIVSDTRRKTALAPIPLGLDFVCKLEPTEYQFRKQEQVALSEDDETEALPVLLDEGDGIRRYGFLAQDILELEGANPVICDNEDEDNLKLHESYIVPVLVNAIKELADKVAALEAQIKS